ncbi:MAG: 1-acyl-sn-glycerol-3-phosphate acyltransferase [Ureaplasma sp.]|nr:1-acyl-sn-glycerol-3-phosphate acyltransferase [Ureaplasma sp.]
MLNFIKLIGWILSWPFLALILLIQSHSCYVAGRRYRKDKTVATPEERYLKVYKLVRKFLYWKNIKINSQKDFHLPNKPLLLVANHKSNVDPLIIFKNVFEMEGIPYVSFIAKTEIKDTYIGYIASLIDTIFIDRKDIRQLPEIIDQTAKALESKRSVCVFLEGTRVYDQDSLGNFHSPILESAYRTHSSIQPIVLENTLGMLDRNHEPIKNNKTVKIRYLHSLNATSFINMDRNILAKRIHDDMEKEYIKLKIDK